MAKLYFGILLHLLLVQFLEELFDGFHRRQQCHKSYNLKIFWYAFVLFRFLVDVT